jgi:ABC-type multidrug transport system ATPase subunit
MCRRSAAALFLVANAGRLPQREWDRACRWIDGVGLQHTRTVVRQLSGGEQQRAH